MQHTQAGTLIWGARGVVQGWPPSSRRSRPARARGCCAWPTRPGERKAAVSWPRRRWKDEAKGGVLATQAVETRGKRRCLSHAGGGNTRQRRRLTVTWTPGRAMASTACVIACLSSENLCPARSKDPNVGRVSYQASKKPRDAENLDDKLARFRTVSRTVRKN